MNIILDWNGTIAKATIALEAKAREKKALMQMISEEWTGHSKNSNWTGEAYKKVFDVMNRLHASNEYLEPLELQYLMYHTMKSDHFKHHYNDIVNEWRHKLLYDEMYKVIEELSKNNNLIIASSMLRKTVLYSLELIDMTKYFCHVYGNTYDRRYSKTDITKMAQSDAGPEGIQWMVGDKLEDKVACDAIGANWIYPTYGRYGSRYLDVAKYPADEPKEILDIIKSS